MSATRRERPRPPTAGVAALLDAYPDQMRTAALDLRAMILGVVPGASNMISYGMPAIRYRGRPLLSYAAWKMHLALYSGRAIITGLAAELAPWDTSGGTIRFTPDRPLPRAMIERIARLRMADIDARVSRRERGLGEPRP